MPCLHIDTSKIYHNTIVLAEACREVGMDIFGVTKGAAGLPAVARAMLTGGAAGIADSRLLNLEGLRKSGIGAPLMLLRSPTLGEAQKAVDVADIILCSSLPTMEALSRSAVSKRRQVQVIITVEMGDRREGIMPEEVEQLVIAAEKLPGISVRGLGANFACFAGVVPTDEAVLELEAMAKSLWPRHEASRMLSVGNSSSLSLVYRGHWPRLSFPAHLRVGESILLGWDVMSKERLLGTSQDAFRLFAEVIEVARKPSLPGGATGCNAFDVHLELEDRGIHWRAIVAIGRQDLGAGTIRPVDIGLEVIGMTSDHTVLAIDKAERQISVGSQVEFRLDYGGLVGAMTSPYVGKLVHE
ncbi:MAG: alanine/ornithine racemase family PLP-dependent enzyme [Firmicutes bacterium]|nr:alanine/ornithine racemase family PLP-dependent enzyme [Bacillota bacterium]